MGFLSYNWLARTDDLCRSGGETPAAERLNGFNRWRADSKGDLEAPRGLKEGLFMSMPVLARPREEWRTSPVYSVSIMGRLGLGG